MVTPARYHDLRDRTLAAVDQAHAEPVWLSFLKDEVVDPDRTACQIEAPLRTSAGEQAAVSGGRDRDWEMRQAGQKAFLAINRTTYPDIVIKRGDKVRALSRPGKPWFAVLFVDDRSHTRLIAHLGEA